MIYNSYILSNLTEPQFPLNVHNIHAAWGEKALQTEKCRFTNTLRSDWRLLQTEGLESETFFNATD